MRSKHIGLGIFLLSIGAIWLLINFGIINWSILDSFFKLWPLILIVIGVSIAFRNNGIVRAAAWLAFVAVLTVHSYYFRDAYDDVKLVGGENFTIEKHADTREGELTLSLGGLRFDVGSDTSNLVDGNGSFSEVGYVVRYSNGNEKAFVDIKDDRKRIEFVRGSNNEHLSLDINRDVVWDMDVDVGAAKGELDMSDLRIREFDMDAGVGKIKLIFGNKHDLSKVKIDAGVSSVDIVIPREAGVRIDADGLLNRTNFKDLGFVKNDGYYESANYDSADCRFDMDIDMGIGELSLTLQ